jgi:hypothetical protein
MFIEITSRTHLAPAAHGHAFLTAQRTRNKIPQSAQESRGRLMRLSREVFSHVFMLFLFESRNFLCFLSGKLLFLCLTLSARKKDVAPCGSTSFISFQLISPPDKRKEKVPAAAFVQRKVKS